MKFFNWMQNKFSGGQENKKQHAVPTTPHQTKRDTEKEEFSDWPNGLLAIGTFGNVNPESQSLEKQGNETFANGRIEPSSSPDLTEFIQEEIGQLQKELTKLLTRKPPAKSETEIAGLPLDRFLNCPSSLEVDRRISCTLSSTNADDHIDEDEIDRTIRVILGRCKDVRMENKKKGIGKNSISFLVNKMFVCRSGFAPSPSLRDTFQESRMERLLRTMISRKVYSQSSSRGSSSKKYIEDRHRPKAEKKEEIEDKSNDKCKWVKTDSECTLIALVREKTLQNVTI